MFAALKVNDTLIALPQLKQKSKYLSYNVSFLSKCSRDFLLSVNLNLIKVEGVKLTLLEINFPLKHIPVIKAFLFNNFISLLSFGSEIL